MGTVLLFVGIIVNVVGAVGLFANAFRRIGTRRDVTEPGYRRDEAERPIRLRRYIWLGLMIAGIVIVYVSIVIG